MNRHQRRAAGIRPRPRRVIAHAHQLVADTAKEAARELYDSLMSNNELRANWLRRCEATLALDTTDRSERAERLRMALFVDSYHGTPECIQLARATLARLLASPTVSDDHKETIMEALELDDTLALGRQREVLAQN